ncbi:hypothetical protein MIC97_02295 [Aquamicrobium sp. NLF2-7]|uniref:hypothetical protein n=1 Tax=Aquamicrobium sp. NLF2-7 TaxID=2918753 RepID=UPI001EFBC5AA|nr:hypothetical protein [Aquamicrobium sp. NLF2-7]MCG8270335.1 hypothetical protein [Aquamicrobium sp. NLF2-7]
MRSSRAARVWESSECRALREAGDDEFGAILAGMLVGVCGVAPSLSRTDDATHAMIRAAIVSAVPDAIDQARSIAGLSQLPRADQ